MGRRAIAENGEHGIDRHDSADEESDGQKTEIGGSGGEEEAPQRLRKGECTALAGPRFLSCFNDAHGISLAGSSLRDRAYIVRVEARPQLEVVKALAIAG